MVTGVVVVCWASRAGMNKTPQSKPILKFRARMVEA
jgi:hypothetical protein